MSSVLLNAQNHTGGYQVKPPDVNAFEAVNFAEANEYSGKIAISIPIFEFSIDGVAIPISIDYNSNGILVDEYASRVGLGWSLQAGGIISKSIQGINDFELSSTSGESGGATADASWFTSSSGIWDAVTNPSQTLKGMANMMVAGVSNGNPNNSDNYNADGSLKPTSEHVMD